MANFEFKAPYSKTERIILNGIMSPVLLFSGSYVVMLLLGYLHREYSQIPAAGYLPVLASLYLLTLVRTIVRRHDAIYDQFELDEKDVERGKV